MHNRSNNSEDIMCIKKCLCCLKKRYCLEFLVSSFVVLCCVYFYLKKPWTPTSMLQFVQEFKPKESDQMDSKKVAKVGLDNFVPENGLYEGISKDGDEIKQYRDVLKMVLPNGKVDMNAFEKWNQKIDDWVMDTYDKSITEFCKKYSCDFDSGKRDSEATATTTTTTATTTTISSLLTPEFAYSKDIKNANILTKRDIQVKSDELIKQTNDIDRTFVEAFIKPNSTQIQKYSEPKKTILLWNDFFGMKDWELGFGSKPFESCHYKNCLVTKNRTEISTSSAVVFHINQLSSVDRPKQRNVDQRWVFFNMESPRFQYWTNREYQKWNGLFNWTMTYREDSDVRIRYGAYRKRLTGTKSPGIRYKAKKYSIVWMVSNCNTPSKRWKLYQELFKHIKVNIYGKCGAHQCSKNNTHCMKRLGKRYKFYLAFENALCKDYTTEKAFAALESNMVPIVYGLANYSKILPPNSFIDVRDFSSSARDLANHLASFGNDKKGKERYKSFFEWRDTFEIVGYKEAYRQSWCDLCEKLNLSGKERKVYEDISAWWNSTGTCKEPNSVFDTLKLQQKSSK